jgi:DNA-binding protein Fis
LPHHLSDPTTLLIASAMDPSLDSLTQLDSAIQAWTTSQLSSSSTNVNDLYDRFLKATEPALLRTTLQHAGGQRGEAARILGIHRETLRDKLKRIDDLSK